MTSLIRVLPDLLINQIAAGEVIEDSASVVKELIENALDAGARTIDIELLAGGHRLIRLSDDGRGMSNDDAVLCFERHATSKIHSQEDLEKLFTMGFRGEALAAIASVSKITLRTALSNGIGTLVEIHGGKLIRVDPCARSRGTTIEVRDLFYNTPARRKFQKNSTSSSSKIERCLTQISLGHHQIEFSLAELEKKIQLPRYENEEFFEGLKLRMGDSLGLEFARDQIRVEANDEACSLKGYISPAQQHRPQRSGQVIFINGRLTNAPLISYAVRDAYATRLPEGRHPLFVIHLTLPSHEVDVNVHPQKKEVRFRQEEYLRKVIHKGILEALEQGKIPIESFAPVYADFGDIAQAPWTFMETRGFNEQQPSLAFPSLEPKIIALLSHYLLVEGSGLPTPENGIAVIDLQKALERIMYDNFTFKKESTELQKLLIPLKVEISKSEAVELRRKMESLRALGIVITEIGERLFSIEEIPHSWETEEVTSALYSFLAEESEEVYPSAFRRCIKKKYLLQEAEEILRTLLLSSNPHITPLGQPTMVYLEESGLRRLFTHVQ